MLFNSLTFVAFFAIVLAFYWSMRSWNGRKNLLLVASYIFYGAWNPPFAALLFSTTALDFYLGRKMGQLERAAAASPLALAQCGGQPQHARLFQVREFSAREFYLGAGPRRYPVQAAAPRCFPSDRHFFLHLPLVILHARYLSRRYETHPVATRFHPGSFILPTVGRGSDRPRGRFSSTIAGAANSAERPLPLGIVPDDAGIVRESRAGRHPSREFGRSMSLVMPAL